MKDRQGSSANSTVTWQQQGWHGASVKTTNLGWSCRASDLDRYHLDLPVDVPLLHVAEAPGFDGIPGACIHPDQTVVGDADQLLALPTLEPTDERKDALTAMKVSEGREVWINFGPHLARKWVIPNSGRDCHAWMKRIFASIRLIWATFWWASRIRAEIWQRHHCHVSTQPEMTTGTLQWGECLEAGSTYN